MCKTHVLCFMFGCRENGIKSEPDINFYDENTSTFTSSCTAPPPWPFVPFDADGNNDSANVDQVCLAHAPLDSAFQAIHPPAFLPFCPYPASCFCQLSVLPAWVLNTKETELDSMATEHENSDHAASDIVSSSSSSSTMSRYVIPDTKSVTRHRSMDIKVPSMFPARLLSTMDYEATAYVCLGNGDERFLSFERYQSDAHAFYPRLQRCADQLTAWGKISRTVKYRIKDHDREEWIDSIGDMVDHVPLSIGKGERLYESSCRHKCAGVLFKYFLRRNDKQPAALLVIRQYGACRNNSLAWDQENGVLVSLQRFPGKRSDREYKKPPTEHLRRMELQVYSNIPLNVTVLLACHPITLFIPSQKSTQLLG